MELSEFQFEKFSFEIRYGKAFILWDRAGSFANELQTLLPGLELREAIPSRLQFTYERNIEIAVEMDKTFVISHYPKSDLKAIEPITAGLTKLCKELLEVSSFDRVGARFHFFKEYDSLLEANQVLLSTGVLSPPQGKYFGHDASPKAVDYTMRWEGKTVGTTVRLQAASLRIEFMPPPVLPSVKPIFEEKHRLIFDVDYFSTGHVLATQLDSVTWIQNAAHIIHRDANIFIGAGG